MEPVEYENVEKVASLLNIQKEIDNFYRFLF